MNKSDVINVLVTGAAGFIGYHLCLNLIKEGYNVIGLDSINNYYDVKLKYDRLSNLGFDKKKIENGIMIESSIYSSKLKFIKLNLEDINLLTTVFKNINFDVICNLAAQAGVRYSLEKPMKYIDSNIIGFMNILQCAKIFNVKKFVYASSSSVYGNTDDMPLKETHDVSKPISVYAATKVANELFAHTYSNLYEIDTIGLRFFTVYGPYGRPDMATFLFTNAILNNKPIKIFNGGNLFRDFTYIDDIINGVTRAIGLKSKDNTLSKIYNIGNNSPVNLLDFIDILENKLNKKAKKIMCPMQPGDVYKTFADSSKIMNDYDYFNKTSVESGISKYVDWHLGYYK